MPAQRLEVDSGLSCRAAATWTPRGWPPARTDARARPSSSFEGGCCSGGTCQCRCSTAACSHPDKNVPLLVGPAASCLGRVRRACGFDPGPARAVVN